MNQETLEKDFMDTFAEYSDAIFRFCLLKVSSVELAEDMTQEVFLRYWQYLRDEKPMTNTRSLLYTMANNMAKDWYKKKKSVSLDEKMDVGLDPIEQSSGPLVQAEYQEVMDVMAGLEQSDKEVLVLKFVEGLPPKDIALIMNESANVISVRINRATKRLQKHLGI